MMTQGSDSGMPRSGFDPWLYTVGPCKHHPLGPPLALTGCVERVCGEHLVLGCITGIESVFTAITVAPEK